MNCIATTDQSPKSPFLVKYWKWLFTNSCIVTALVYNLYNVFHQSGFKTNHSTETVLIKVVNYLKINNVANKPSILVFLDLTAAFDTVDSNILLSGLEN